jgi:hypothetical protein
MAALTAWLGIVALSWATASFAASGGTAQSAATPHPASALVPKVGSVRLLHKQPTVAGTCGGSAFNVAALIHVDTFASADVTVTAPGVGVVEQFTDETGSNIGPFDGVYPTFHILPFGGGLPPNTLITITITTYTGPKKTGTVSSVSALIFNCTTGLVLHGPGGASATEIPALSPFALAATAALLALLGAALLRRQARQRARRR